MHLMLAASGYPWTILSLELRADYWTTLDKTSVEGDIEPLTTFLAELLRNVVGLEVHNEQKRTVSGS